MLAASGTAHMKLQMFGTVGRATVPAETGRHGGRPYDSTRQKFLFRFDWTLAARGCAHMKLRMVETANRRISNKKFRMMKCGIAALSLNKKVLRTERVAVSTARFLFNSVLVTQY
jgi:hypothetical protein